jgi:uncharacterized protein (TIGR00255 family)
MAIYSMTGYARVQVRVQDQLSYTLSLKSVNHRFLDVQLRIPNGLDALEIELRKAIKDALVRGHVDLTISVDRSSQQKSGFNLDLVSGYLAAFEAARTEFRLEGEPDLNVILRLPGALQTENRADEDLTALADSVRAQIGPLLQELKTMRSREGEALAEILNSTLDRLTEATNGVAELRPEIEQRFQDRLAQRLLAATRVQSPAPAGGSGRHRGTQRRVGGVGAHACSRRALPGTARGRRRSRQEARLSAPGDESRSQHHAFEDRRRGWQRHAHD